MVEQKDMHGVLFKNERRREGKEDPHLQGSCTIDGRRYWLSAWTNTIQRGDRQGEKYIALSFRLAEDQRERQPAPLPNNDDILF